MRVLVCGGRDFADSRLLHDTLTGLGRAFEELIEGGASGADGMAYAWADRHGLPVTTFKADWKRYGNRAGPIRNQRMLDEGKPDLVVAFPGGRGTADMVKRARAAGVRVIEATTHSEAEV